MNEEWSLQFKTVQANLKKATLDTAIQSLLALRSELFCCAKSWQKTFAPSQFSAQPFVNAKGYHSKTLAYSIWHVARIEDIVLQSLVQNQPQIFFDKNYQGRINAPFVTTGNELVKTQIAEFSRQLNIEELFSYFEEVKLQTDDFLRKLQFENLRQTFTPADKARLQSLSVVSTAPEASWLTDYWCGKSVKGLVLMPFSRHWIMHIEAGNRICTKLEKMAE